MSAEKKYATLINAARKAGYSVSVSREHVGMLRPERAYYIELHNPGRAESVTKNNKLQATSHLIVAFA